MGNSGSTGYNFGREQNNRNESSPNWTEIAARVAVAFVVVALVAGDAVAFVAVAFVVGAAAIAGDLFRYLSSLSSSSVPVTNSDPGFGWVKCNVDGSFLPEKRLAGCGGVYRDSKGNWLYGFSKKLVYSCNLTTTEIDAIYMGLKVAWERGYKKLIIESDSTAAVKHVKDGVPASHNLALAVNQAREYLNKDWAEIKIDYVPREYNKVADKLAALSHDVLVERLNIFHSNDTDP